MLSGIARLAAAQPRRMALTALVVVIIAGVFGGPVAGMLKAQNAFRDPSSQSARAEIAIEKATGAEPNPGVIAIVAAPPGSPAVASAARAIGAVPGVVAVKAPHTARDAGLVSTDGQSSIVAVDPPLRGRSRPDRDEHRGGGEGPP